MAHRRWVDPDGGFWGIPPRGLDPDRILATHGPLNAWNEAHGLWHPSLTRPLITGGVMRALSPAVTTAVSIRTAAGLFETSGLDLLPVIDAGGRLVGGVLSRDVDELASRAGRSATSVAGIMRSDVPTATFDEAIADVLEAMASYAVATVPVVTHRKYLEGLVVLDDLARIRGYASAAAKARRRIASRQPGARAAQRG